MAASRHYDRFHDVPQLVIATGYFLLIVAALLLGLSLDIQMISFIANGCQLIGLGLLLLGYYFDSIAPEEEEESAPPVKAERKTDTLKSSHTDHTDWVTMLSADPEEKASSHKNKKKLDALAEESLKAAPKFEKEEKGEVEAAVSEPTIEKQQKVKANGDETKKPKGEVDLSYLAQRARKKKETDATGPTLPEIEVESKSSADQVADNKAESTEKSEDKPESREDLINDLFPLGESSDKVESASFHTEPTHLPGESIADKASDKPLVSAPTETTDKSKKKVKAEKIIKDQAVVIAGPLSLTLAQTGDYQAWLALAGLLVLAGLVIVSYRHRTQRGGLWLMAGWFALLFAQVAVLLSQTIWLILALSVLGYCLVGLANWHKIRGKVTRHFLTIIGIMYLLLALLTVGLAVLIVRDQTSLSLLLVLMTGVLVVLLPIIHALIYSYPPPAPKTYEVHEGKS